METNTLVIVFFFCLLAGTLILQGISGLSRSASSKIGIMPLILGIAGALLMIFIIKNDPFQSIENLENIRDEKTIKAWGIASVLFLLVILLFFMKLNSTDPKYSLASGFGICGTLCGLAAFACMFLVYKDLSKMEWDEKETYYLWEMAKACYVWYKFILLAAVGLLCGTVFNTSKLVRYACLLLAACYFLSSSYFTDSIVYLFYDSDASHWDEFYDNVDTVTESIEFLRYTPFVGWIILMVSTYLQAEKEKSNR